MALDLNAVKARAQRTLRQFSPSQLTIIALLGVVAVVGTLALVRWVSAPSYEVLLGGLESKDAAAVTDKLKADGVPYQLAGGGTTVLVPSAQVDAERIAVAAAGLPQGTTSGYELLDKQGLTSSSFQQKIAYQRALEGELSRTLSQMHNVRTATVHLALAQEQLFTDDQKPARASVLLDSTGTLGSDEVEAVSRLVASAVPDLDPTAVTVSDTRGRVLSQADGAAGSSRDMAQQQAYEDAASNRAETMLAQVLGPDHAVVRVNAEIDRAQSSTESETYDPTKTVVLRDDKSKENYTSSGATPGGIVSIASPSAPAPVASPDAYTKDSSSSEYGTSRTVAKQSQAPGGLKRLTVAVALDANAANRPTVQEVQQLVANAVGLDPARGDTIAVTENSFLRADPNATKPPPPPGLDLRRYIGTGVAVVLLLIVGLALLKAVRRGSVTEVPLPELPAGPVPALPATQSPLVTASERLAADRDQTTKVLQLVDEQPEEVASLLRTWLAEPVGELK